MCLQPLVRPLFPVSVDPILSPAHSLGISFGVGSPWTLFGQNTISDPLYIFLGCESPGDESDVQIPWVHPRSPGKSIFPLLLMLISKLAIAVVLAAKNISMTSFLFSVYSFISAFISLYFMLTKMAPIQLIYLTGRVCTRLRGRELEKNNGY